MLVSGITWLGIDRGFSEENLSENGEQDKQNGIAIVDLEKVFESFHLQDRVKRELSQRRSEALMEMKSMYQELKRNEQELEQNHDTWTIKEFHEALKETEESRKEFLRWVETRNQELITLEAKWRKNLFEVIFQVLEELRKERDYRWVLNKSSLLVYDSSEDWTSEMIRRLRSYKAMDLGIPKEGIGKK